MILIIIICIYISTGSGRNTVVFVTGSGTPSSFTDFYRMQMELKPYARTVSFDKAGFGWNEKTDIPRTIDVLSGELHELLEKSGQSSWSNYNSNHYIHWTNTDYIAE